ncbi:MAG: DUF342 domain-containing protein [Phycisphaerales bacterium]|nr:MAG: DUF342 domain-containing protein [Phycisphaerales bacterium]
MSDAPVATCDRIVVEVADDLMSASIRVRARDNDAPPKPEEVVNALTGAKLHINDAVKKRVREFFKLVSSGKPITEPFLIAEGQPVNEGKDEELVWDPSYKQEAIDWQGDASINYYSLNSIVTVKDGTVIGTASPVVPPKDGMNVKGEVIKAQGTPQKLLIDDTIQRSPDDPCTLISVVAGRVVQTENKLHINEVLHIAGDLDFSSGNVDSTTDVYIGGSIPDRFQAKSAKTITVKGTIEAAVVEAEGDITVRGGIVGRNEGRVYAKGNVNAKFFNEADVAAEGNVLVGKQLMNSRVRTGGRLIAECTAVIGGHVCARSGIEVAVLGSEACTPTRVFFGASPDTLKHVADIDADIREARQKARQITEKIQPLLDNMKRLTPAQREQATEFVFKAEEITANADEKEQRRNKLLEEAAGADLPRIIVSKIIYPRVTISLGRRTVAFDEELKGPITIEERKIKNVTEFVIVNRLTGSVYPIKSMQVPMDDLLADFAPFMETPAEDQEEEEA